MKESELKQYLEPSLYRILCLNRNATAELIKKSYREQQKLFHPDKNTDNESAATEKSVALNEAYKVLSNPDFKLRYDKIHDEYYARKEELARKVVLAKKEEEAR